MAEQRHPVVTEMEGIQEDIKALFDRLGPFMELCANNGFNPRHYGRQLGLVMLSGAKALEDFVDHKYAGCPPADVPACTPTATDQEVPPSK